MLLNAIDIMYYFGLPLLLILLLVFIIAAIITAWKLSETYKYTVLLVLGIYVVVVGIVVMVSEFLK